MNEIDRIQELKKKYGVASPTQSSAVSDNVDSRLAFLKGTTQTPATEQPATIGSKINKVANFVTDAIGARAVADTYGSEIAKIGKSQQEKDIISSEQPTVGQTTGSALQTGSIFIPVGTVAKGAATGLKALGVAEKAAQLAGNVTAGAATGAAFDVGEKLQTGETSGVGTALGTAIPLAGPIVKGASSLAGSAAKGILGKTTGVGSGTIQQAINSTLKGGEESKAFIKSLRGDVTPEKLVEEAKNGLGDIIKERSTQYRDSLSKIKANTTQIDHTPIIEKFNKKLEDFGVAQTAEGVADFSRAPGLGRYEKDLTSLSKTLSEWGTREGDNTIAGIDKLKQVIDDYRIGSQDSAKFDSFVKELRNEAKTIIRDKLVANGDTEALNLYNNLLSNYEQKTETIREIQKGLSLGDKASVDTAFRKLTSSLRTNNEFRKELVQELDQATGGYLSSRIAGQQMSELLPRGLSGVIGTVGGYGAAMTGVGLAKLIPAFLSFSPRAVGELINAMGIAGRPAKQLLNFLEKNAVKLGTLESPGDMFLKTNTAKNIGEVANQMASSKKGFVKLPETGKIVKAIDEATKVEINKVLKYLNQDKKFFVESKLLEDDLIRLADKYEINLNMDNSKIKAALSRLLEKTKTK